MAGEIGRGSPIFVFFFFFFVAFALSTQVSGASQGDHRYTVEEVVPLFVNKVGPLNNPSETYQFFDLPFCRPDQLTEKEESLGEVLNGDRLTNSLYELKFREDKIRKTLCNKTLTREDVAKFRDAISSDFYFQMYYDDLPLWGFIGKVEEQYIPNGPWTRYYLFKHVKFDILYNGNQVIEIRAFGDPNYAVDITEDAEINVEFSYSVFWNATTTPFERRMEKYLGPALLPDLQQIHWFSIIDSIVIIILMATLLSTLFIRTLRKDLVRYSNEDEEADKEEVGWKHLHGDVFRYPPCTSLFCAILGTGAQLLTLVLVMFLLASLGFIPPYNQGLIYAFMVMAYALTSVVAGYTAASFRAQLGGARWEVAKTVLLTGVIYFGPLFLAFCVLNTIAITYHATAALPFGTIIVILLIWMLITIPLLILGGLIGNAFRPDFVTSCTTRKLPLEIPQLAWYRRSPGQIFLAGFLPFSAIVIELHYVYASLWGHKIYTVYGILFIMFIILIVLTAMMGIGLTYLQLSAEDHQWWWRSVLNGGSTSIFMYCYGLYFYGKSSMSGFMQLSFFLGYNACICYAFFLMLGTIGFHVSLSFVRHIYRTVKLE